MISKSTEVDIQFKKNAPALLRGLFFLLIIAFGSLPEIAFSQKRQIKFERISVEEGLSLSFVQSIMQDSRGFMWIGTSEGLNRYDGYEFKIFKTSDKPNSLSHNNITHVYEDSRNNIWIGTWYGLNKFDRNKKTFISYERDLGQPGNISSNYIQAVFEDKNGRLWVGAYGGESGRGGAPSLGGLNLYDSRNDRFIYYPTCADDSLGVSGEGVGSIYEDSRGEFWVGHSNSGLKLFDRQTKTFTTFLHDPNDPGSISSNKIRAIYEDSRNNLWICTRDAGICRFDREKRSFIRYQKEPGNENSLTGNAILSIAEDSFGNLWIGTDNEGLSIFDPKKETFYNYAHDPGNSSSLSNNSIYAIYKDEKGNMWLGTFSGGVSFYSIDGNQFTHYKQTSSEDGLNNSTVFCIREDSEGNILLATDGGGLNIYDKKTGLFSYLMHDEKNKNSICGNHVLSVLEDSYKNIWVGTWADGVTMYNKQTGVYKHFKNDPDDPTSISGNNAWVIFEDSRKDIWIGTYWGGVSRYDRSKNSFIQYKKEGAESEGISANVINSIAEDRDGNIWIGTVNAGLDMLDVNTGLFTHHVHDADGNSISNNIVTSIYVDSLNGLWIGTANGLNYLDLKTGRFTVYNTEDGLTHNYIRGILNDDKGHLWISSNGGISRFHVQSGAFKNFSVSDGLQAPEFKTHAAWRSADGAMYFGGINGFNKFHPDSIEINAYEPPIVFTDFRIFNETPSIVPNGSKNGQFTLNKSITETREITLNHNQSVITFEFASLNYTLNKKKQYRYMLEGFDQKWNHIGTERTAAYTNLKPGKYILKVRGLNNAGEWSKKTAELKITIVPPFWSTWWFRLLATLGVLGALYGIYRYRISLINIQKKQLEKEVNERTSELMQANQELMSQKEILALQKETLSNHAKSLKQANVEISRQRSKVEKLYTELKDSIRAAEVIQTAILPTIVEIRRHLPESFIYNVPKDTVSGDFYWFDVVNEKIIFAVADCTGHGVSGALMSINGYHFLNKIIYNNPGLKPSEVLQQLQKEIIDDLHDDTGQSGMDIALCILDLENLQLDYAGAASPLYIVRNGELMETKPGPLGIGRTAFQKTTSQFADHSIQLQKDDIIYLFSDGYADQIGGPQRQKLMYPRFRRLLKKISAADMEKQVALLDAEFHAWRGDLEQLDDILVLGFKIT